MRNNTTTCAVISILDSLECVHGSSLMVLYPYKLSKFVVCVVFDSVGADQGKSGRGNGTTMS